MIKPGTSIAAFTRAWLETMTPRKRPWIVCSPASRSTQAGSRLSLLGYPTVVLGLLQDTQRLIAIAIAASVPYGIVEGKQ
jgi:hypothetical protein